MNNNLMINIGVVIGFFLIHHYTNNHKDEYNKVSIFEEISKKIDYNKYFTYSIIGSVFFTVLSFLILKDRYEKNIVCTLLTMIFLYCMNLGISYVTDSKIKRVNRFMQRYSYIVNIYLLYSIQNLLKSPFTTWITIGISSIVLFVCFLFMSDVGGADFRALFLYISSSIFICGGVSLIVICITMLTVSVYVVIKQKKAKIKVPITHTILFPLPFLVVIFGYFNMIGQI